ncbi:MAG: class II aldolase/adducin family protein [Candidatus Marinimicrobia bacterium]|nr:class II aldolase/adducin family protein [Candidatus Neomarinimicrobiota bacterium]
MSAYSKNELELRKKICEVGQKLYKYRYIVASDGNISVRLDDKYFLITPSGMCKGELSIDEIIKMDFEGNVVNQTDLKPSIEYRLHLFSLKENNKINCIIHAHPPYSTICAVSGISLDGYILPETFEFGNVPLVGFSPPGSLELAKNVCDKLKLTNAVLLANHGLVVAGCNIKEAYYNLERAEFSFMVLYFAKLYGRVNYISDHEIMQLNK